MKTALIELLSNKKFLTAIVGAIVALAARYGLSLDDSLVALIVSLFASAIIGQGVADHGKTAAQITADAMRSVPRAPAAVVVNQPIEQPRGFIRLGLMLIIAAIASAVLLAGCGGAAREKARGYTLATVTAVAAQVTPEHDAQIQDAIATRAHSVPEGDAALKKYRADRKKVIDGIDVVLDALRIAYTVDDDASVAKVGAALGQLLTDAATLKGDQ